MTANSPNRRQGQLIESTDGIYLVDAGAGTGKTFTLSRRYARILQEQGTGPDDILLITFTNNAAAEMKERVIHNCDYDPLELQEAPISTFHSLCQRLLLRYGFSAPYQLGFSEPLSTSTRLLQNETLELEEFRRFLHTFIDANPSHHKFLQVVRDRKNLLGLIKSMAAKGIFPLGDKKDKNWYQQGEAYLDGIRKKCADLFETANAPGAGKTGPTQSELLKRIKSDLRDKCFAPSAPAEEEIVAGNSKQVSPELLWRAFGEEREGLKQFIHDLYAGYINYCLSHNYLNFSFLQMFAYVLLSEEKEIRRQVAYDYVMVDEFQDTSEIQFKLTMLLADRPNICAVGDWKQSIYSFQYANVDNIQDFEDRLARYKKELNLNRERITYPVTGVEKIPLEQNYRSTQQILNFSEESLALPATGREEIERSEVKEKIVHLQAQKETENSEIQGLLSPDEPEAILQRIQEIVADEDYVVYEDGEARNLEYSDIAVLARTRSFGLQLQQTARHYGLPVAYEGGVELFKTEPGILLLAWLRVLDSVYSKRGWAVILEEAGYNLPRAQEILAFETPDECTVEEFPSDMLAFREDLISAREDARGQWAEVIPRKIFDRYGIDDGFSARIVEVLVEIAGSSYMSPGDLVNFIEDNISAGITYDVDNPLENAVTIQTIHAAKGLEYPAVFIADVNQRRFPGTGGDSQVIDYSDPVGLRQKKILGDSEPPYDFDNWPAILLHRCLTGEYDEERRLMYVAMTRAQQYLYISADADKKSSFFKNLADEMKVRSLEKPAPREEEDIQPEPEPLKLEEFAGHAPRKLSVHDLMDEPEEAEEGRGKLYGRQVHSFAEKLVAGEAAEPANADEENIASWFRKQSGEMIAEEPCLLPVEVVGRKIVLSGVIDLINIKDNTVRIVDYKTDRHRENVSEYQKQLSVYYHVLEKVYQEKEVTINLLFSSKGTEQQLTPLSLEDLKGLVAEAVS
ncbi:MAG: UvrD-helicase domain-containing protein [bacterium]